MESLLKYILWVDWNVLFPPFIVWGRKFEVRSSLQKLRKYYLDTSRYGKRLQYYFMIYCWWSAASVYSRLNFSVSISRSSCTLYQVGPQLLITFSLHISSILILHGCFSLLSLSCIIFVYMSWAWWKIIVMQMLSQTSSWEQYVGALDGTLREKLTKTYALWNSQSLICNPNIEIILF